MKKYNAILWDLDGTLLDTLEDLKNAVNHALSKYGFPEKSLEEVRRFLGNGIRNLVMNLTPGGEDNPVFEAVFNEFRTYYDSHNMIETKPYDGIMDILGVLNRAGVPMAIVTNKIASAAEMLRENVFEGLIPLAVGDGDVKSRKPDPEGVKYALEKLGISEGYNVVYIGDSEVDAATARNAGLDCILCEWGFRSVEELRALPHVATVSSPNEILGFIDI